MNEKPTSELNNILEKTHLPDFEKYCSDNKESMNSGEESFSIYIKGLLDEKKITQQAVFINADIPERYGYKLLSNEKHTRQRDVILRICYAAEMTLDETQRALKKYGMPELYSKIPRDALLMIIFQDRPGTILDVNAILRDNNMELLRTSGLQD